MITMTWQSASQIPSGFTLPMFAATPGSGLGIAPGLTAATSGYVLRDRHVVGATLTQGAAMGPTVWSPPIC